MSSYMVPLLIATALKGDRPELTEALLAASPSMPAAPRMLLALKREDDHARELAVQQEASETRLNGLALELHRALVDGRGDAPLKLSRSKVESLPLLKDLVFRLDESELTSILEEPDKNPRVTPVTASSRNK